MVREFKSHPLFTLMIAAAFGVGSGCVSFTVVMVVALLSEWRLGW